MQTDLKSPENVYCIELNIFFYLANICFNSNILYLYKYLSTAVYVP